MMIPFLQKHVTRFDGWTNCGNDGFKFFGTSMDMIFARSLDLADKYLCQFIQEISSVSPSPRNFFRFCKPPPPPNSSVLSSSCKPVTAQLTLHNEKSKIKILLGERIVCTNKQWQKRKKQAVAKNGKNLLTINFK